jgi:hypothetical protein
MLRTHALRTQHPGGTGLARSLTPRSCAPCAAQGLTASSLQECLSKLAVRREEALVSLFGGAADRLSADPAHPADPDALAAELAASAALAALQARGLADEGPAAAAASLAAQHAAACEELQRTHEAAAGVRVAAELHQRLADFDAHVAAGAYAEAAWTAVELQKASAAAPGMEATQAAVEARVAPLRDYVGTAAAAQLLAVDPASHVLLPPDAPSAAALKEVWAAAEVLGVLPQALQSLAAVLVERCVKPALAAEAAAAAAAGGGPCGEESPAGSVASSALSLATTRAGGGGGAGTERGIYKSLRAACDALGGRPELAAALGEAAWPAAAAAYVAAKLRPVAPRGGGAGEVEAFSRAGGLGARLEGKAAKLGLLPPGEEGPVARYVRQVVARALGAKRARYAAAARDLLTSAAAQETSAVPAGGGGGGGGGGAKPRAGAPPPRALFEAVGGLEAELAGEPSVLEAGAFVVTRAAEGLAHLMRDALGEACRSGSPATAQALCGAVVDMAALLVALPPPGAADAQALPYPAALRHNDCLHVHRALCALPALHAPRLQALVHPAVNFAAPAARVRAAGEAALEGMVRREEGQLVEVAAQAAAFGGMDEAGARRCRKGVMQLLHAFRRVGSVLRGVLPPEAFVRVAGSLMEAVCAHIAGERRKQTKKMRRKMPCCSATAFAQPKKTSCLWSCALSLPPCASSC